MIIPANMHEYKYELLDTSKQSSILNRDMNVPRPQSLILNTEGAGERRRAGRQQSAPNPSRRQTGDNGDSLQPLQRKKLSDARGVQLPNLKLVQKVNVDCGLIFHRCCEFIILVFRL
jgi:hypothetical protein